MHKNKNFERKKREVLVAMIYSDLFLPVESEQFCGKLFSIVNSEFRLDKIWFQKTIIGDFFSIQKFKKDFYNCLKSVFKGDLESLFFIEISLMLVISYEINVYNLEISIAVAEALRLCNKFSDSCRGVFISSIMNKIFEPLKVVPVVKE